MIVDTDLSSLIGSYTQLRKVAGTHGGEMAGACPFCGGKDRFRVWPNAERPGWWCRMCEKGGDAIQFLREQGYSYPDACRELGVPLSDRTPAPVTFIPPLACEAPSAAWQATGAAFVAWSIQQMTDEARAYLIGRGLTEETIKHAEIGFNPTNREVSRAKWGLPQDKEHGDRFWLPAGLVIPCRVAGVLWKIQIRRDVARENDDRYKTVTGSGNALYGADTCQPGQPAMLVEGPIDQLAVWQCAGDTLGVAASGTSGARRTRWLAMLARCSEVLVSLDADAAGDSASDWWLMAVADTRRWRPWYADPAQMLQDGADVRQWALAGLGCMDIPITFTGTPLDYWREELRLNCAVSLDRLRSICAARGASVAATVRGLTE